jgi:site-specific DNA recombinase
MANGTRAAIYARRSALDEKLGRSVSEQEQAGRGDCEAHAWAVAGVYTDDARSASRFATKRRDDWQRLLGDLTADRLDLLWLWESDRGSRELQEWAGLLDNCRRHSVLVHVSTHQRTYDPRVGRDWRALAEDGVDSAYASEKMSVNLKRAMAAKAEKGEPHGFVAYGWRREHTYDERGRRTGSRDVLVPEQADVIREASRRLLGGESLRTIVKDLNRQGVPSPREKPWRPTTLRQVLLRRRNAGRRVHLRADIGAGNWEAILDPDTHARLVAVLRDPDRRTNAGAPRSKYLLSGVARCGRCPEPGTPLRVLAPKKGAAAYVCPECFLRRNRRRVDDLVTAVVVGRLAKPDAVAVLMQATGDDADVKRLTNRRDELRAKLINTQDDYIEDRITEQQRNHTTATLRPKLEKVEADLRTALGAATGAPELVDLCREDIAEVWGNEVPLERKRAVIAALVTIRVLPIGSGARWNPRSVEIKLKGRKS